MFELSRLEGMIGNTAKQREYLEELLHTKIAPSARMELGVIEYNEGVSTSLFKSNHPEESLEGGKVIATW